jgi:hypothetical protein
MPRGRPKKRGGASKSAAANGATVNKLGKVRETLGVLGKDARPVEIQEYLKKNFNIDMNTAYVSKYKSLALKQLKAKRRGRKPAMAGAGPAPAPVAKVSRTAVSDLSLEDIRTIKELSGRLGATKVCELVDLVAR